MGTVETFFDMGADHGVLASQGGRAKEYTKKQVPHGANFGNEVDLELKLAVLQSDHDMHSFSKQEKSLKIINTREINSMRHDQVSRR